jgi:hypothetical protein
MSIFTGDNKNKQINEQDNFQGVGASNYLNSQGNQQNFSVVPSEKKSIFGADNKPEVNKPNENFTNNANRSRSASNNSNINQNQGFQPSQSQGNLFQNPLFNVGSTNPQPQETKPLQTFPSNNFQQQ